jgi:hypothetical protein
MKINIILSYSLVTLLCSSIAFAQQTPPPPDPTEPDTNNNPPETTPEPPPPPELPPPPVPPPPPMDPSPEYEAAPPPPRYEPPPRTSRTHSSHLHDGFYLRMALGISYLSNQTQIKDSLQTTIANDYQLHGVGPTIDFFIGGTPGRGLVIGGGIVSTAVSKPTITYGGRETQLNDNASAAVVGPFIDWYFNPRRGFHAQLLTGIGLSQVTPRRKDFNTNDTKSGSGFGIDLGIGHDWWISNQWSIGILARYQHSSTTFKNTQQDYQETRKTNVFGISTTFTLH